MSYHYGFAALLAIPLSTAALADIVQMDSDYGTGSITRDLDNGLDYLDLTQTIGISYNDMVSTHLASGGQYEGWRHATRAEYFALVASAGIVFNGSDPSPADSVNTLINLLGQTFDSFGDGSLAQGITGTENGTGSHIAQSIGFFRNFMTDEFEPASKSHTVQDHVASTEHGHFLVRAVPTPGSATILAMTRLLAVRRRR